MSEGVDTRRQVIVERAQELFARFGYRKTTTEDIAKACKLTKGALYHHFVNKEQIFAAVIEKEGTLLLEDIESALKGIEDPIERIRVYVQKRFDRIMTLANLYGISESNERALQPHVDGVFAAFQGREKAMLGGILRDGMACGVFRTVDAEVLASLLLAGARGVLLDLVLKESAEKVRNALRDSVELMCYGLVKR